jgi:hypothetical protein
MNNDYKLIEHGIHGGRYYYTVHHGCSHTAYYQPVNAKTGRPWQASRHITRGISHQLIRKDGTSTGYRPGDAPEGWHLNGEFKAARYTYASEAEAVAAVQADIAARR